MCLSSTSINISRLLQNGCYFADDIFQYIPLKDMFMQMSLKFVHGGLFDDLIIVSIGSGNDTTPTMRKAITWINDDLG